MLINYHSWMFYNHFIATLYHFLGLTYWPSAQCQLLFFACFLHRRKSISNRVQTPRNFLWIFYGPEDHQWARAAPGGVVHPRGWGFVPVAMCLISLSLSLSRVLEMSRSWCMAGFVNIVRSYGVFPSLSCDELSFPFDILFYRIEYFYGFERAWYMYCKWILVVTMGVLFWFTWYMFWHSTRGFPRWHWGNLRVGVDARSWLCFSDRNLGALFEVLCVVLSFMNLNLLWCYSSTNSW